MYRNAFKQLNAWKIDPERKPLILKGARQVGKTWLMKEFGKQNYKNTVYFNFDERDELKTIFEKNKNPERIIELLSLISQQKIRPNDTLIILDEIQECANALNSLKYFQEQADQYHIIAAGSLLGTLLSQPKSYPVGKVNLIEINPLSFDEFLRATNEALFECLQTITNDCSVGEIFHDRLLESYHYYLITGGMPECVMTWIKYKDPQRLIKVQRELLQIYEHDFSKHNGKINSARLLMVFRSIVSQLAKENRKFLYGVVKEGARAREFEEAVEWLVSAGILNRVYNVTKAEHPLPAFDSLNCFKLYFFDTGLLKCMAGIENALILLKSDYQFKGALAENFVLQQLKGQFSVTPRYFSNRYGEIDFLLQNKTDIIPVEVKSGESKNATTFKKYISEKNPKFGIRFSEMGCVQNNKITNIPLYLASNLSKLI